MNLKTAARSFLRPRGWEIRRLDPHLTLDTYLWFLFPHLGVNTVLDVGARVGEYGQRLRANGYRGHIVSFEPVRANWQILSAAARRDQRWTAYPWALGAQDGNATINVTAQTSFSSFRTATAAARLAFREELGEPATEVVSVRRLDRIFDEVTRHIAERRGVYLKIDTQGWDVEVLQGADDRLDQVAALQMEASIYPLYEGAPTFAESMAAAEDRGFRLAAIFPVASVGWRLAEVDCVLARG